MQNPRPHPSSRKVKGMSVSTLVAVLVVLISVTAWVQLRVHTQIASLNTAIERQGAALEDMDKTYREMRADLDEIKNSDEMMRKAKFQLGMVYPDDEQIRYIDVRVRDRDNDVNENVYLNPVISVLHIFDGK